MPHGTHFRPRTYITGDLPGLGGVIKQRPEDFLVDEIPAYTPSGAGEHLYLLVQKRSITTLDMVSVVARHFRVPRGAVGYAGLKDKNAITRQAVSVHVPGKSPADFPPLEHERIHILGAEMHANKLRPGHLKGNRFSIKLRGISPTGVVTAKRVLDRLHAAGVPNRIGEQRFGLLENNHLVGRALVLGDFAGAVHELLAPHPDFPDRNPEARRLFTERKFREAIPHYPPEARTEMIVLNGLAKGRDARAAMMSLDEAVLRYYLSAFQSAVFNAALDGRIDARTLAALRPGDVAFKHDNGAVFAVDDAVASDPDTARRLAAFEISPSGPMWGAGMVRAAGLTDDAEVAGLRDIGLTPDALAAFDARARGKLDGKRRPYRVPLTDPEVEGGLDEHGPYVRCAFELPRGSFATVVLREVMKPVEDSGEAE